MQDRSLWTARATRSVELFGTEHWQASETSSTRNTCDSLDLGGTANEYLSPVLAAEPKPSANSSAKLASATFCQSPPQSLQLRQNNDLGAQTFRGCSSMSCNTMYQPMQAETKL